MVGCLGVSVRVERRSDFVDGGLLGESFERWLRDVGWCGMSACDNEHVVRVC